MPGLSWRAVLLGENEGGISHEMISSSIAAMKVSTVYWNCGSSMFMDIHSTKKLICYPWKLDWQNEIPAETLFLFLNRLERVNKVERQDNVNLL